MLNIYHSAADAPDVIPRNSIVRSDCFDVFDKIPDASVDCILCDLPYGTTACSWDAVLPFDKLWAAYKRILKPSGVVILTASQPFTSVAVMSNLKWFKYNWVWDKVVGANFLNIKNRPLKTHEDVLIFAPNANFVFNPQRVSRAASSLKRYPAGVVKKQDRARPRNIAYHYNLQRGYGPSLNGDGKKHPISIIQYSTAEKGRFILKHPTKKPLTLFKYLVETYTNKGMLVLDNCAGSGTTGHACIDLERDFILIEREKEYFEDKIIPRLEEAIIEKANPTPQKAKKKKAAPAPPEATPIHNQLNLF